MEMKQNCFLPESLQNRRFENYPVKKKKKENRRLFIPPLLEHSSRYFILYCKYAAVP